MSLPLSEMIIDMINMENYYESNDGWQKVQNEIIHANVTGKPYHGQVITESDFKEFVQISSKVTKNFFDSPELKKRSSFGKVWNKMTTKEKLTKLKSVNAWGFQNMNSTQKWKDLTVHVQNLLLKEEKN